MPLFVIRHTAGPYVGRFVKRGGGATDDLQAATVTADKGRSNWASYEDRYQLVPVRVIRSSELEELTKDSSKLAALEAAGVDNWDGYDFAMKTLAEEDA